MDSIHVKCRNLLKRTWGDYQNLKKFLCANPDEDTARMMAFVDASDVVDPVMRGKIGKGKEKEQEKPMASDEVEKLLDLFRAKYEWEVLEKKGVYDKTIGWAHDSIYNEYKLLMDQEYGKALKKVLDTDIFNSLKGQPCGAVSNILSSMFLGDSLSEWTSKNYFGKAHVSDSATITTLLGTVKRVPTWVFVRVEAVDFGHSYAYIGHVDDTAKADNERRIIGIIYQSNMHQTLGDAMFSLGRWVSSVKFESEIDLEHHLTALRTYKNKDIDTVMEFVNTYYLADGLRAPEETKQSVQKAHGRRNEPPDIWLIIRPISQMTLEENYQKYVKNVIPLIEAINEQLI